jgi:hypothetical protein
MLNNLNPAVRDAAQRYWQEQRRRGLVAPNTHALLIAATTTPQAQARLATIRARSLVERGGRPSGAPMHGGGGGHGGGGHAGGGRGARPGGGGGHPGPGVGGFHVGHFPRHHRGRIHRVFDGWGGIPWRWWGPPAIDCPLGYVAVPTVLSVTPGLDWGWICVPDDDAEWPAFV